MLFVANSYESSQVTIMTLIKQSAAIVAILSGKFVYGEKIARKLWCAAIIIFVLIPILLCSDKFIKKHTKNWSENIIAAPIQAVSDENTASE